MDLTETTDVLTTSPPTLPEEEGVVENELILEEESKAYVDPTHNFSTDQSTVSNAPQELISKGTYKKAFLPGERQKDLMDFFRMVANAEFSEDAAYQIIQDIENETGDFAEGEFFEKVDPTTVLEDLVGEFPDPNPFKIQSERSFFSYDLMDEYKDAVGPVDLKTPRPPMLTPPKYSNGAEVLKKYIRSKKYQKESPYLSFFDQTVNGIKNGVKDIPTGLNKTAWHGVNTLLAVLNWGTGDFVELAPAITDMTPEEAKELREKVYALSSYIVEPEPVTLTGKLTAAGTEAYLSYITGTKVYSTVAPQLAKWIPKMAAALKTPSLKLAASEAIGSGAITTGELRWATMFSDLGADNAVVESLKHAEDETVFQERWKSFLDGAWAGPAFASLRPVLGVLGTAAFILHKASQKGVSLVKQKWNRPKAIEALNASSNLFVRVRQNYPKPKGEREALEIEGTITEKLKKIQEEAKKVVDGLDPDMTLDELLKKNNLELEGTRVVRVPDVGVTEFDAVLKQIDADSIVSFIEKSGDFDWLASKQDIFNLKNIDDTVVKDQIAGIAEHIDNIIDVSTKPHIKSLSEGIEVKQLLRSQIAEVIGEEGVDLFIKEFAQSTQATTGTLVAIKLYTHEALRGLDTHIKELAEGIRKGIPLTPEQRGAFGERFIRTLGNLIADRTIAQSGGRALNIQKAIGGTDEVSQKLIKSFTENSDLESKILAMADADVMGLSQIVRRTRMTAGFDGAKSGIVNGLLSNPTSLTAVPLGICCYIGMKHGETWIAAGLNPALKYFYRKGVQNPITAQEARGEAFGLYQALFELMNGAGYYARSAIKKGVDAARTLEVGADDGILGLQKQMGKETDRLTGKPIRMKLPIVGEFNLQKGINEEMLSDMLPNIPKEELPKFLKFIINGIGAVWGYGSRAIMSQDGYFRTVLERMTMHGESVAMARKRLSANLPKDPKTGQPVGKLNPDEVTEEAFHITKNLPESIEKKMRQDATVGLMQEQAPWLIKQVDRLKNTSPSSAKSGGVLDVGPGDVTDLGKNLGGVWLTEHFAFQKTTYNIWKQSLTERGMFKLAKTLLKGKDRQRFMTDQRFAQEVLAKTTLGSLLMTAGVGLTYKAGKHGWEWFSKNISEPIQEHVKMEGIDANLPENFYGRKIQGRSGPEVILRNSETGEETAIPINRLDLIKQPLILGAIFGSYLAQLNEAQAEVERNGWTNSVHQDLIDEIEQKAVYAIGNIVLDSPMMQGAKETSQLIPGWGNKNWNWTKEAGSFIGDSLWHNSILSSLRKNLNKVDDEFRMSDYTERQRKWGDVPEDSTYPTKFGVNKPLKLKMEPLELDPFLKVIQQLKDIQEKVGFMDIDTDPDNPVVGSMLYQMVDPEGNLIRYVPSETESKIATGLKILVLPWYPKPIEWTNTTFLMEKLGIPYDDPKHWDTGTKAPLSAEHRYVWAVNYGRLNKKSFEHKKFQATIKNLKEGTLDKSEAGKVAKNQSKLEIEKILTANKKKAMLQMLAMPRNSELQKYWKTATGLNKSAKTPF